MKLKFFLALILVVLLGGCSLLPQDDEEAPFLADASKCDVASSPNMKQPNRCAKQQKLTPKSRGRCKSRQYRETRLIHSEQIARKLNKERSSSISPRSKA